MVKVTPFDLPRVTLYTIISMTETEKLGLHYLGTVMAQDYLQAQAFWCSMYPKTSTLDAALFAIPTMQLGGLRD